MKKIIYLIIILLVCSNSPINGQIFGKSKPEISKTEVKDKFKEKIKKLDKIEGLFNLYRDKDKGNLFIEITKEHLDKEFIHFSYIENGVTDAGFFRGNFRGSKVFKIQKCYNIIVKIFSSHL